MGRGKRLLLEQEEGGGRGKEGRTCLGQGALDVVVMVVVALAVFVLVKCFRNGLGLGAQCKDGSPRMGVGG